MSEMSQGPGWWQASDGKWYPPQSAPPPVPAPAPLPPPAKRGLSQQQTIAIIVVVALIAGIAAFLLTRGGDDDKTTAAATRSSSASSSSSSKRTTTTPPQSSSAAEVPDGFKVLENRAEGLSLGVPNDFTEVQADPNGSGNLDEFATANPDLAPFLDSAKSFLGNVAITAHGPANEPIVIAARSPQSFDVSDTSLDDALEQAFSGTGAVTDFQSSHVDLPAGPALRIETTLRVVAPDSSEHSVNEVIYFVNAAGKTFALLGVSVTGNDLSIMDQIADTFTVVS